MNNIGININFIENEDVSRDSSGGVMSYLINLSNFYVGRGFKTTLYGDGPQKTIQKGNVNFSKFFSISGKATSSNFVFFLRLFGSKLISRIDKNEIIHVQRPEMVIPVKLRTRNRVICTLHGGQDLAVKKKKGIIFGLLYSILQFFAFLMVDELIVVDKTNFKRYITKYPWVKKKLSLIPISVDTKKFSPRDKTELRTKYNLPKEETIILFIGRLEYEKNVEFIIKAFEFSNEPNCKLLIIGNGSLKDDLLKLAAANKENVIFYGEIHNSLIPEVLNCANALVLASHFEGSPTVVKEALCCNIPVISTDVGDVKEVLEEVNGGEIIGLNNLSFKNSVKKLKSQSSIDIVKVRNIYNHEIMGDKTLNIYQDLC